MVLSSAGTVFAEEDRTDGWILMFDGKTFDGCKATEITDQWTIVDGTIKTAPGRSHPYYEEREFTDFEMQEDFTQ